MRKKQQVGICVLLIAVGFIVLCGSSAVAIEETTLFVTIDSAWEHAHEGDTFVVRADVENIGEYTALITRINLENIPDDWNVHPHQQLILQLNPGESMPKFFIIERGSTDSTIYATAHAVNAPLVQSNRIAIPISIYIMVGFALVCGIFLYREVKIRKKQYK